jgi:hypothetical protein
LELDDLKLARQRVEEAERFLDEARHVRNKYVVKALAERGEDGDGRRGFRWSQREIATAAGLSLAMVPRIAREHAAKRKIPV